MNGKVNKTPLSNTLPPGGSGVFSTVIDVEREHEMIQATQRSGKSRPSERNDDRASRWKIFPTSDEHADETFSTSDVRSVPRDSAREGNANSRRAPAGFYRNDTSGFLGELQEAENLLHQKVRLASKIDFRPPSRKTSFRTGVSVAEEADIDRLLSDADVVPEDRRNKISPKNVEQEKLVVDVNDFVETFAVMRDPVYLKGKRKETILPDTSGEIEHILDGAWLKRKIEHDGKTIEEKPTPPHDASSADRPETDIDRDIDTDDEMDVDTNVPEHATVAVVTLDREPDREHAEERPAEPPIVEETAEQTVTVPEKVEVKPIIETVADKNVSRTIARSLVAEMRTSVIAKAKEIEIETVAEPDLHDDIRNDTDNDANDNIGDNDDIATEPVKATLPGVLRRLAEFAGDQCDLLAEHVKDRVYDGNRLIAFCGMKRGAGCSTMTLLAAKGMTQLGLKTAVIDANFEFPRLNAIVTGRQDARDCWVDILHGDNDWESVAISPEDASLLTVFPLAENSLVNWSQHEPEILQQETNRLIATLHEQFDLVLLDCGCFEDAFAEITWGELELFQPDGVVLVYAPKETAVDAIVPCCREIAGEGIKVFGTAENFA